MHKSAKKLLAIGLVGVAVALGARQFPADATAIEQPYTPMASRADAMTKLAVQPEPRKKIVLAEQAVVAMPGNYPSAALPRGNSGKTVDDDFECMLEPHLVSDIGSPVEGILDRVTVDRGDFVRSGQVVANLRSDVEQAAVNLSKAQEEFGKRKVLRNVDLYQKNLISAGDKDELETQTRIAGLDLKQKQEILNQRTIRSPLNGVVVERYLGPGERVSQEKILKIAQIDPLNVEMIAPVELFGSIHSGMTGEVSLSPLFDKTFKAKVTVVDRVIDAASGTFGVRLELNNPGNKIPAGIKCKLRFKNK